MNSSQGSEPMEKVRCPACGGLNPADADWCGQCLKRFTPPPPPTPTVLPTRAAEPADAKAMATVTPLPTAAAAGVAVDPGSVGTQRGAFRVTEHGILWRCARCETENPIEVQTCSVCGADFAATVRPPPPERPERDPGMTTLISLFLPGAGHAYLGMWGQAIARGMLSGWLVLAMLLSAFIGAGGSTFVTIMFAGAAFALWGITAHDAYRSARGEETMVLLKGRRLTYAVFGLIFLTTVILVALAISNSAGATTPGLEQQA